MSISIRQFNLLVLILTLSACGGGGKDEVESNSILNLVPMASNINITDSNGGYAVVGDSLAGSYTYSDTEGDEEGASTFQWLRNGSAISEATATTYTLTSDDSEQLVSFEVTPVAITGTLTGSPVRSDGMAVITASIQNNMPIASNVSITDDDGGNAVVGDTLTGSYIYSDVEGDSEGVSTFQWLRNGSAISEATTTTYTLTSDDSEQLLAFEVTPVAGTGVSTGLAVSSDTINITSGFSISGVVSGLNGSLTVSNNNAPLVIDTNGTFTFANNVGSGKLYSVSIIEQPVNQVCSVSNASGEVAVANIVNINILCVIDTITVTLSGSFSAAALTQVDSDINDPYAAANISNDTFSSAQEVPNFSSVNGFATKYGTGRTGTEDRFEISDDTADFYQVALQAGQVIRMHVVDFDGGYEFQGDLDLFLFDNSLNEVAYSESIDEFEEVRVPADGIYFIQVLAFDGTSKYVLSLDAVSSLAIESAPEYRTNEVIVKFKAGAAVNQFTQNMASFSVSSSATNRAVLVSFPAYQVQSLNSAFTQEMPLFLSELQAANPKSYERYMTLQAIKGLRQREDVAYAEPNYIRRIKQVPNDTHYNSQWHYPAINLPQAWDITTGSPVTGEVIVAVVDTGLFLDHPDFNGQLVDGFDFISDNYNAGDGDGIDANPDDPGDGAQVGSSSWHGTHVAGTIAAKTNNNSGVAGVSWNAKIMPLRVLGRQGGTDYDIMQAVLYAAGLPNDSGTLPSQKADIINLSLGGPWFSQSSQEVYARVIAEGVIVVAAAGNENSAEFSFPAAYDGVISVAATDYDNNRAPYSNFGTRVDIAAPGGDSSSDLNHDGNPDGVLSTLVDDSGSSREPSFSYYQGTSMAAPHVSGVLALMKSVYPDLSPIDVDTLLAAGNLTNDIGATGRDNLFGYGIIDALRAVQSAQKLANNGTLPELPPLFLASPSSLSLGFGSSGSLVVTNEGAEASITEVSDDAGWLMVISELVDANGLGTYRLTVDRAGLNDSSYTGNITFSLSTGSTLEVKVTMIVGNVTTEGNIGSLYMLLLDPLTDDVMGQADPVEGVDGVFSYQFENVAPGTYKIIGGSDIDNDLIICQLGESCGGFPVLNDLSNIVVTSQDISDLDFVADLLSGINSAGSGLISTNINHSIGLQKERPAKMIAPGR